MTSVQNTDYAAVAGRDMEGSGCIQNQDLWYSSDTCFVLIWGGGLADAMMGIKIGTCGM